MLTLGADGRGALRPTAPRTQVAAAPAEVVDTTGAGDAFCAGFLASWTSGRDPADALAAGAAAAARRPVGVLGAGSRSPRVAGARPLDTGTVARGGGSIM